MVRHEREAGVADPAVIGGMTKKTVLPVSREFDINADTIDIDNFEKFSYTASTLKGIIAIEKNGDCL